MSFDRGLIAFENAAKMLVATAMQDLTAAVYSDIPIFTFAATSAKRRSYLKYHRTMSMGSTAGNGFGATGVSCRELTRMDRALQENAAGSARSLKQEVVKSLRPRRDGRLPITTL